ncbi:Symplekin [Aphelenchoides besseyi]|nr:Symplekin [Aphelenchoides besseyi]
MTEEVEVTINQKIGELINNSRMISGKKMAAAERLKNLQKAEKLIFETDEAAMLDNFLDEMLEFMNDEDEEIRAFTMMFVTSAVEQDPEIVNKVVNIFNWILQHDSKQSIFIKKCVVIACTQVYSTVLAWANQRRNDTKAGQCWKAFAVLKNSIMSLFDSKNEGLRIMCIKFMEMVIICQTTRNEFSQVMKGIRQCISLTEIHRDHRVLSYQQLEREAQHSFSSLIDQLASSNIASQTLLTILQVICNIARQRPIYMIQVLSALESLHINLPPTLATNQVKSLRKEMRYELLHMLRHPANFNHHQRLTQLLSELGSSSSEINRHMPAPSEVSAALQRRTAVAMTASSSSISNSRIAGTSRTSSHLPDEYNAKRIRLDDDEYVDEGTAEILRGANAQEDIAHASQRAIDITTDFVYERLSLNVVVKLVTISLFTLPDEMPPAFQSTYTRIPDAGTDEQKRHLARILAIHLTKEGEGPGIRYIREEKQKQYFARQNARLEGAAIPPTPSHEPTRDPSKESQKHSQVTDDEAFKAPPVPKRTRLVKWDLIETTKGIESFSTFHGLLELMVPESKKLVLMAFKRITEKEQYSIQGGAITEQQQLLVRLASRFHGQLNESFEELLIEYIIRDQKNRVELALFHRILLETPLVTTEALNWLRKACLDPTFGGFSMTTLKEMILKSDSTQRHELLELFLSFGYYDSMVDTHNERITLPYDVRESCVTAAKELLDLTLPTAPLQLVANTRHLTDEETNELHEQGEAVPWDEQLIRSGLYLFMAVLPVDHSLLKQLASITANAKTTEVKRVIFRTVERAVKAIGMRSPDLLDMIENCPVGAEPLVARVVHLLTERTAPTAELVEKVRSLHKSRNTDVRSLLPILTGLPREELLELIPKFVMNATNSKSVPLFFRKLMFARHIGTHQVLMSPVDLLIQLHQCETKNVREHSHLVQNIDQLIVDPDHVYQLSKEFIAKAIEDLLSRDPLPKLLYHTIQKVYDNIGSLKGFLLNVLQKAIHSHPKDEKLKELQAKFLERPNKENAVSGILAL